MTFMYIYLIYIKDTFGQLKLQVVIKPLEKLIEHYFKNISGLASIVHNFPTKYN